MGCSSRRLFLALALCAVVSTTTMYVLFHWTTPLRLARGNGYVGTSRAVLLGAYPGTVPVNHSHRRAALLGMSPGTVPVNHSHRLSAATRPPTTPPVVRVNGSALQLTVSVSGQLGNHMFQYASLLGIARQNNREPFYATSSGLANHFQVTHVVSKSAKDFEVIFEKNFASYDPSFEHLPNVSVTLMQYLQSWKYFHSMRDTIRKELTFKQHVQDAAANLVKKHSGQMGNRTRIGIHIRRGDMLLGYNKARGYHTAPASYVIKAMNYTRQKYGDVIFLVVSSDIEWCKTVLKGFSDVIVVDAAAAEVHLALLASCDHVIMTVGTYGWWGGYLSGGEVVYYWDKDCLHSPPLPVEIRHPEDFYPPEWTSLPA